MRFFCLMAMGMVVAGCAGGAVKDLKVADGNGNGAGQARAATRPQRGDALTEGMTTWNANPKYGVGADGALHVLGLRSYEGIEEPHMKWVDEGGGKGHAEKKEAGLNNITDVAPEDADGKEGVVRMMLRYRDTASGGWWDGDQGTSRKDRQRAEVKGVGPHQKNGETYEYATTWRTNEDFTDPAKLTNVVYDDAVQKRRRHFCHVFQLKATDGDDGAPMITMSVEEGDKTAAVDYWSGSAQNPTVVRVFPWKAGEWTSVVIRVKTSTADDGGVWVSVNGDAFSGIGNVAVYRNRSTQYRPKWGLYRAAGPGSAAHDDWVEHADVWVRKLD